MTDNSTEVLNSINSSKKAGNKKGLTKHICYGHLFKCRVQV